MSIVNKAKGYTKPSLHGDNVTSGFNGSDITLCRTCKYWSRSERWCEYVLMEGKRRESSVDDCQEYVNGRHPKRVNIHY